MKKPLFLLLFLLMVLGANAQTVDGYKHRSQFYEITSFESPGQAAAFGSLMDALFTRYNSFFLFDVTALKTPLKVVIFADKKAFDSFLSDKIKGERQDFIYVNYKDPEKSLLAAYPSASMTNHLAFQGFVQFLWSFIPQPPVWIRNGFAYHFWDVQWNSDKKAIEPTGSLSYLDALKTELSQNPAPPLQPLLLQDPKDQSVSAAMDYLAWGLVHFLINSDNPTYTRLLGNLLANLDPMATSEANSKAVESRINSLVPLSTLAKDMAAYFAKLDNFPTLIDRGIEIFKAKDYKSAGEYFKKAQALSPKDFFPLYYQGLCLYELKDYTAAESFYSQAAVYTGPPGLLAFARGLNAFYAKNLSKAREYLAAAKKENEGDFGKVAQEVLDLMN